MKKMIRWISVLVMLCLMAGLLPLHAFAEENPLLDALESKAKLRFDTNGDFRILVLSDLHTKLGGLTATQQKTINDMVDKEDPDLVIFTGDNVRSLAKTPIVSEEEFRVAVDSMVGYLEQKGIYWMHVFGNHDEEDTPLSLETQQAIYESYDYCLSKDTVKELNGVGNYVVPLYGSDTSEDEIKFAFWGLDAGNKLTADELATYFPDGSVTSSIDFVHDDQIDWYVETSEKLEEYVGAKVPGLMAIHIPFEEYITAWKEREGLNYSGEMNEGGITTTVYDDGLYEAMVERGDIKLTVCGHNHNNNYMVEYGGIKLCFGGILATNSYYDKGAMGARVITLKEENPVQVDTYMSYLAERNYSNIASGYTYDFETDTKLTVGYGDYTAEENRHDTIYAEIVDGKGVDGSKALATCRTEWGSGNPTNNAALKWKMPVAGYLGDNEYLMVWMDFAEANVDFRKAAWGLLSGTGDELYCSYSYGAQDFYYKADGSDEWVTYSSSAGSFGAGVQTPIKGLKGWFAFRVDKMATNKDVPLLDGLITGFYFYYCPLAEDQVNKPIYIDNVMLVQDYRYLDIKSGTTIDFETDIATEKNYKSQSAAKNSHQTIYTEILEGKGVNGSKALATCRTEWGDSNNTRNVGLRWSLPDAGYLGDNKYLVVWMNMAEADIDFRKAAWGLLADGESVAYCTYSYDYDQDFYYKADGTDEWIASPLGSGGCMGSGDKVPVKGYKGWFAFPVEHMWNESNVALTADTVISGFYLYYAPLSAEQVNKPFYVDNIMLAKDYRYFNIDNGSVDFETDVEIVKNYKDQSASYNSHETIYAELAEGKGVGGSTALATCRTEWGANNQTKNTGLRWKLPTAGYLGDKKYLMVWMDMAEADIDFRKAAFGLLVGEDAETHCTYSYDYDQRFYYKADGTEEWVSYLMGSGGCIGAGDNAPVKGYKGWFAFAVDHMWSLDNIPLTSDSLITHYYFYYCPLAEDQVNKPFYVDNVMLVKNYRTALQDCDHIEGAKLVKNPATCGADGSAYTACTVCGTLIEDDIAIPATGKHSYDAVVTPPSANAQGFTTHTCSGCGHSYVDDYTDATGAIAIGDTRFATLQEALDVVTAGQTICLMGDTAADFVSLKPAVTLDLNGNVLTANYVVGFATSALIDGSADNGGKLIVPQKRVVLDSTNSGYLPVYEDGGYSFTTVKLENRVKFTDPTTFVFSPVFEIFAHEALMAGKENSGVKIVIRLEWEDEDNYAATQDFAYLDGRVAKVIGSYDAAKSNYALAFSAAFAGSEAGAAENVKVSAVVLSETGVEIASVATTFETEAAQ